MTDIAFFFHTVCFPVELSSLLLGFIVGFCSTISKDNPNILSSNSKDNNFLQSVKFSPSHPSQFWMMNHDIMPEILKAKFPLKLRICVLKGQIQGKGLQRYGCTQVVAMFLHSWYYNGMPSHIPSPLTCGPQIPWKPSWTREQHWSL